MTKHKIDVLDHGYIELDAVFGSDADIARIARLSYKTESHGIGHDVRLLKHLMKRKHTTPFEFGVLRFKVKAPQMVCQQWIRHRTWCFNFVSGRHVPFSEVYIPNIDTDWPFDIQEHITQCMTCYKLALAAGIKPEQARVVIPGFAVYYEFYAQANVHNFMHWLRLRLEKAAQWEHRQYAQAALKLFHNAFPETAELFEELNQEN